MVKNGIRASKFPSFEEATDWMESVAVAFVFGFPILLAFLIFGIAYPQVLEFRIPVINVNIGQYLSILCYLIFLRIFLWHRDRKRREYAESKAEIDRQDDEEYQEFVRLAGGRTS